MAPKRKQPAPFPVAEEEEGPHPVAEANSSSDSDDDEQFVVEPPKQKPVSSKKKKPTSPPPPPPPPPPSQPSSSKKAHKKKKKKKDAAVDDATTPAKLVAAGKSSGKTAPPTAKDVRPVEVYLAGGEKSEDGKKALFQRVWTEDDEIVTLQGILDLTAKKGIEPKNISAHMVEFHDHIKSFLHFDPSLNQLKDKVFRLRKKFGKAVRKKKGEDVNFSNPNDQKAFSLWKKIWGSSMDSCFQIESF